MSNGIEVVGASLEVVGQLLVRNCVDQRARALDVAPEGDPDEGTDHVGDKCRGSDGDGAALAATAHRHPCRIDERQGTGDIDRSSGVDEHARVVARQRVKDSARDESELLRVCRVPGIGCVRPALSARVHDERGPPR